MAAPPFEQALVVDDFLPFANAVARAHLCTRFAVRIACSEEEAADALRGMDRLRLALVDMTLGVDADAGLRIVDALRTTRPDVVTAVVTGSDDARVRAMVRRRRVPFLQKPFASTAFRRLRERALAWPIPWRDAALHVSARSHAWNLTPTEHRVLCALVAGRRDACETDLGIDRSAFDAHMKEVRTKAGWTSNDAELAARLLRESLAKADRRSR